MRQLLIYAAGIYVAGAFGFGILYAVRGGPSRLWDAVQVGLSWPWYFIQFVT